jgi:hypothetical protein
MVLEAPTRLNVCHPNSYEIVLTSAVLLKMILVYRYLDESEG